MSDDPRTSVNQHYLEKVMDLAEVKDVEAMEDIFDGRGMKLVAKGTRISRALQEKLILHKLKKPLESSIAVEGGVNIKRVVQEAECIAQTNAPVIAILEATSDGGLSPLKLLAQARFGSSMAMMLSMIERGDPAEFTHSVMVSVVALCLAKKLGVNDHGLSVVALAGLLHDIGELYIDPAYLSGERRLLPHEWRHVVAHPRIGQMLILELENFPPAVAQAVAEHHERFDGAGYPRQSTGKEISIAGQALSVAEMISGVFMRPECSLERAELAVKIIPGQHSYPLVSVISSALRLTQQGHAPASNILATGDMPTKVDDLFQGISSVLHLGNELMAAPALQSKTAKKMLEQSIHMTQNVKRAFSSTGLDSYMAEGDALTGLQVDEINSRIHFEIAISTREIQWRMRDVARNLALQSARLDQGEIEALQPLIQLLDQSSSMVY